MKRMMRLAFNGRNLWSILYEQVDVTFRLCSDIARDRCMAPLVAGLPGFCNQISMQGEVGTTDGERHYLTVVCW